MSQVVTAALDQQVTGMGQIVPIQAETGTGKTLAYLVPCAIHAAAIHSRTLVSTHTIALGNQILLEEAPVVQEAVGMVTGRRPRIAHMRGRRHFLSPSRILAIANLMQDEGATRAILDPYRAAAEQAKIAMDKAEAAIEDNEDHADLQHLIEACLIDRIEERYGLQLDRNDACLLSSSPDREKSVHTLSRRLADHADLLVTTHAYTALSLARRQLFEAEHAAFDSLVIDEADQWASAAASVSLIQVTIFGLRRLIESVIEASSRLRGKDGIEAAAQKALRALDELAASAPQAAGSRSPIGTGDASDRVSANSARPWNNSSKRPPGSVLASLQQETILRNGLRP